MTNPGRAKWFYFSCHSPRVSARVQATDRASREAHYTKQTMPARIQTRQSARLIASNPISQKPTHIESTVKSGLDLEAFAIVASSANPLPERRSSDSSNATAETRGPSPVGVPGSLASAVSRAKVGRPRGNTRATFDATMEKPNLSDSTMLPVSEESRRLFHNMSERRRRQHIREGFTHLLQRLPEARRRKQSKIEILRNSFEHVSALKNEIYSLEREVVLLRQFESQLAHKNTKTSTPSSSDKSR